MLKREPIKIWIWFSIKQFSLEFSISSSEKLLNFNQKNSSHFKSTFRSLLAKCTIFFRALWNKRERINGLEIFAINFKMKIIFFGRSGKKKQQIAEWKLIIIYFKIHAFCSKIYFSWIFRYCVHQNYLNWKSDFRFSTILNWSKFWDSANFMPFLTDFFKKPTKEIKFCKGGIWRKLREILINISNRTHWSIWSNLHCYANKMMCTKFQFTHINYSI